MDFHDDPAGGTIDMQRFVDSGQRNRELNVHNGPANGYDLTGIRHRRAALLLSLCAPRTERSVTWWLRVVSPPG